jgi:hypothetical protein
MDLLPLIVAILEAILVDVWFSRFAGKRIEPPRG